VGSAGGSADATSVPLLRPAPAGAAVGQGVADQRSSRWGLGHRRRRPLQGEDGAVPGGGGRAC
jgi:hypothetical protein